MAKLSCALFTTRIVPTADDDIAAPRARINPGIARVDRTPIRPTTNNKSMRVNPFSLLTRAGIDALITFLTSWFPARRQKLALAFFCQSEKWRSPGACPPAQFGALVSLRLC